MKISGGVKATVEELKRFERLAEAEKKQIAVARKEGVGLLTPELLEQYSDKNNLPTQELVLAYGRMGGTVSFTPEQLHEMYLARKKREEKFNKKIYGVRISSLIRASRDADKERARQVRNATLYQRKGNLLFFRVSGNEQPFYRVQIRLEAWQEAFYTAKPAMQAIQEVLQGRVSIECPCGRHQYWYRYLATIGKYAIDPLEHDFPKIRNPRLTGCCCKHVLRAVAELRSNRVILILARQMEAERGKPGFKSVERKMMFGQKDISVLTSRRMSNAAMAAMRKYKAETEAIERKQTPKRPPAKPTATKVNYDLVKQLAASLKVLAQAGLDTDKALAEIVRKSKLNSETVDAIRQEANLSGSKRSKP